nr:hypothetical protein [Cryobacterium sp. TMT2-10]
MAQAEECESTLGEQISRRVFSTNEEKTARVTCDNKERSSGANGI